MSQISSLKIDINAHIMPPKYKQALDTKFPGHLQQAINNGIPSLWDLEDRFRLMERYNVMHVITLTRPPIEEVVSDPKLSLELTKLANDEMAELVSKYPDRFPAAVAAVSLTDIDGSLKELERAVVQLRFRGVQIYTDMLGKPWDSPEFLPLFEMMAKFNLPIWIHPTNGLTATDYKSAPGSKFMADSAFGWPYQTTLAMTRIVFGKIFERFPTLKVITHHGGAMVPFYEERIIAFHDNLEMARRGTDKEGLTRSPIEYYKMFYADTAIYGNTAGLMLARAFFGTDHLLFATDFPFAGASGDRVTRQTIAAIDAMDISEAEKKKIYDGNSRYIMRLPV
jgi:predicted TIM-barrel fold metal-dependent hydrolase